MRAELLRRIPMAITLVVCLALFALASARYPGFASVRVAANLFNEQAFLGVAAIGVTLVILTGAIDLSIGAVAGCSSVLAASLVGRVGWHPAAAFLVALAFGAGVGLGQGWIIHRFAIPSFLVTLAGLFLCRGIGLWISEESLGLRHPFLAEVDAWRIPLGGRAYLSAEAVLFLILLLAATAAAHRSRWGRTLYAIGGSEVSAELMGLPVAAAKVGVFALSGGLAALSGILFATHTGSGNAVAGTGLELDAIAAAVMGGTLLSGGYGSPIGTLFGLLILAILKEAIRFDGRLSSWWALIATGALLLAFIGVQRLLEHRARTA